jgi:precorrin-6Y C5,15-methyltransferase (decarboxylating)
LQGGRQCRFFAEKSEWIMTQPWLHIVGIGEDGMDGLTPATRAVVEAAEVILGGGRHHALSGSVTAERLAWPSPFDAMIETIHGLRGRRAVVLVTGDPLWFSVGARIGRAIDPSEIVYHPQLSAFQLAAARMGWSLADVETLTVHGRPVAQMVAFIQPDARLLILTTGAETPNQIAAYLAARGFGQSRMTVLAAMGGKDEARFDGVAESWDHVVPPFNTLAVECIAAPDAALLPRVPGLADDLFQSDGTMTKQEIRAATLAKLMPMRGALLWDIGCGSGSVAIEWMRAARYARAIGIEPRDDRRAMAAANALALGAPKLELLEGTAPDCLDGLAAPDAIFIGGGLSEAVFDAAWSALRPLGRLVANAVTLESEAVLMALHARHGGDLVRLSVCRAEPVGRLTGWRPAMPVTQWSLVKR